MAADTLQRDFLDYSVDKLRQLSGRIQTCLETLTGEQIWARGSENENAIGNLVLHLCGNVQQWIVSGVGGAADLRQRDGEFAARDSVAAPDLAERLRTEVAEAIAVLDGVTAERLAQRITVQKYEMTVLAAIYHVVEHFSGHTGQIIFATKMLTGADLGFYRHLRTTAAHSQKTP
jgi:uncharacterized damage-inducible protein DinB